ncbi:unnamed protein product [Ilex paraguariensis]|uniref:Uncharacterized protein n=1 Tax=Ilex paraguariensis TaxID=185542 RepID=A0ABC8R669_9AQUA
MGYSLQEIDDEDLNDLEESQVTTVSSTKNNKQPYLLEYGKLVANEVYTNVEEGNECAKDISNVDKVNENFGVNKDNKCVGVDRENGSVGVDIGYERVEFERDNATNEVDRGNEITRVDIHNEAQINSEASDSYSNGFDFHGMTMM